MIEAQHLVGKIANRQAGQSGVVKIHGVDAHRATRDAIFAERNARLHTLFGKGPVPIVVVKLVGLRVV